MNDKLALIERAGVTVIEPEYAVGPPVALEKASRYQAGAVTLDSTAGWQRVWDTWNLPDAKIPQTGEDILAHYRSWVYACASKNAQSVASTPIRLYYVKKARKEGRLLRTAKDVPEKRTAELRTNPACAKAFARGGALVEIVEHPFLDLMSAVNDEMNGYDALELTETFLELMGAAYWLVPGGMTDAPPDEFYVLPAQHVRPKIKGGRIVGYVMGYKPDLIEYELDEIVYFYQASPFYPLLGYGPGHAAYGAAVLQGKLEDFETKLFENRAMPAGLLVPENPLNESQAKQLLDEWNRIYRGSVNAGKVGLAPFKLDFKTLALNPKELTQLADRGITKEEIAAVFGVPLTKLDMSKADASSVQGDITYARDTVRPRLLRLEAKLNEKLLPLYDEGLFCAFESPVPPDRVYELQRAQAMSVTNGIFEANEVREAFGADPKPELDGEMVMRQSVAPEPPSMAGADMPGQRVLISTQTKAIRDWPLQAALRALFKAQHEDVNRFIGKDAGWAKKGTIPPIDWNDWVNRFYRAAEQHIAGDIEKGGKRAAAALPAAALAVDWTIANPNVREFIRNYTFKFAQEVNAATQAQLQDVLLASLTDGMNTDEVADAVAAVFEHASRYRARMIARTEAARAANAGQIETWRQSGVVKGYHWHAQPDACEFCLAVQQTYGEGKTLMLPGGTFLGLGNRIQGVDGGSMLNKYADVMHPPLHPNCLLPGQRCETPGHFVSGLRTRYNGPAVKLGFANGSNLAVTANHLLLTRDGFARAQSLREGDYVLDCSMIQRIIAVNPDNHQRPTLVEDIIGALSESEEMATVLVPTAAEYLHGDGRFCDGDINVVASNRPLRDAGQSGSIKPRHELNLARADAQSKAFPGGSDLAAMFRRLALAADGIMGARTEALSFSRRGEAHAETHGLGAIALANADAMQTMDDSAATHAELLRKLLDGAAGLIQPLKVVKVNRFSYSGHVYDLQSESSLYIGNGILSSNCRCALIAAIMED